MMNNKEVNNRKRLVSADVKIGSKLKKIRVMMGLSQTDLAKMISISFQQIQKYESGVNRISASTLFEISKILNISPVAFWDEETLLDGLEVINFTSDIKELLKAYDSLPHPVQKSFLRLLKSVSQNQSPVNS
jgi:transcriptional regulator with XRE-family HTH domain